MKTCFRKIATIVCLLPLLPLTALGAQEGDFEFRTDTDRALITGYRGPGGAVVIPNTLGGKPVMVIEEYAFYSNPSLTSLTIPESVVDIQGYGSAGNAFRASTNLTAIIVGALNSAYSSADGVLFNKQQTVLLACPAGKAGNYSVPNSVTNIGTGAFLGCSGLTNVTIPNSVTYVGSNAFYDCTGLTSVTIAKGVTEIGSDAFHGCSGLTSVTIPNSVTNIGWSAFLGCSSLTNVTIPDSLTGIGGWVFALCTALKAIEVSALNPALSSVDGVLFNKTQTILAACPGGRAGTYAVPNSVTNIAGGAFVGCRSLTSITIPNSVTIINSYTFAGCSGLTNVTIPKSVTKIDWGAFFDCSGLTSVTIPDRVTLIGNERNVFLGCSGLKAIEVGPINPAYSSVDGVLFNKAQTALLACPGGKAGTYAIPSSVISIGLSAFAGCTGLTNVVIPNSVTYIAGFSGCTGLTTVTIPNSVTTIGWSAFQGCSSLTNMTIPKSVTEIDWGAFSGCTGLTSITIPSSATWVNPAAFGGCTSLTSLYFEGNAPGWEHEENGSIIHGAPFVTVFYRSGTAGWGATFAGRPTALWVDRPSYPDWAMSTGLIAQFPATSGEGDDADGDGLTNGDEWFAGTDPTQSASLLELELAPRSADLTASDQTPIPAGHRAVFFRSVPGRYYGVQSATSLDGGWTLRDVRVASTTQTRFVLPAGGPQDFDRVLALP